MGFFYAEAERSLAARPVARGPIPTTSLRELGCRACPRNEWRTLDHPKLRSTGADADVLVYLLGAETAANEDRTGKHWQNRYGRALLDLFPERWVRNQMAFGHLVQCADKDIDPLTRRGRTVDAHASACCHNRVVEDIERTRPKVIVGVGDAALRWATGLTDKTAMTLRGRTMPVRVGRHACWFHCVAWPDFAARKGGGVREHELTLRHDIEQVVRIIENDYYPPPQPLVGPYDGGIEIITGNGSRDLDLLAAALRDASRVPQVGLDLETTTLRPWAAGAEILTAAVGPHDHVVAFPLNHEDGWPTPGKRREAWALLGSFLLDSGRKVAHHLGFEQEWLGHSYGWDLLRRTEWGDSMAMAHTLDERGGTKSLEVQTVLEFGFNVKNQSPVDVRRPEWWKAFPIEETLRYNGMDSKWCDRMAHVLEPRLRNEAKQWKQYLRKLRTVPTLVLTQAQGLHVDIGRAHDLLSGYEAKTITIDAAIKKTPEVIAYDRRGKTFNPGNDDDVLALMRFLDRPEITREQRDGSTKSTTDEEALSAMPANEVPSAPLILERRGLEKLCGTYLRPIITGKIISADGLIHTSYSQMVAETSRLAAEDPNVQNFPKRKHREVRAVIWTPHGWVFIAIDFGQMEFRVIGMASEDEAVVRACWTGYDVHGFWAERMVAVYPKIKDWVVTEIGVDWDEGGLKALRHEAKNGWTFPQFFGSSLDSIVARLHLSEQAGKRLDGEFWDEFKGVKRWQSRTLKKYDRDLYVETLDGHRRRGPLTKNQIINLPIQGTAARINIDAMNALSERAQLLDRWDLHPVLNVHDDVTLRMPTASYKVDLPAVVTEMCRVRYPWINVPLLVEVSVGDRWDKLTEIAKYRSDEIFGHRNPFKERT